MKYFMAIYSEARGYERFFHMTKESAKYYYTQWLDNDRISARNIAYHIRHGSVLHSKPPFANGLRIWGEEMTDKELFRLRVKGEIEPTMLED